VPRADRAPDEFLDDEVDNFGNRADYVSPYQGKNQQGRNRRPGAPATGSAPAPRGQAPGRSGPRGGSATGSGTGSGTGAGAPAKRSGPRNGSGRDGQARREDQPRNRRPARDDQPARQEPAVRGPRDGQPAPKIMHKESKSDRFPSAELLDQLPSRPRGEKPALLTRNREG
jgi:ATP-dependent RNA helicase RhlE